MKKSMTEHMKNKKIKESSDRLKNVKKNYKQGLWNDAMMNVLVKKGVITKSELSTIKGNN